MSHLKPTDLQQSWPPPSKPRPIVIIGAGGIVKDAHLPAYAKAKFPVAGVFDIDREAAKARAKEFNLPRVFANLDEALGVPDAVFDIATPPKVHVSVLEQVPKGAPVMIQKPMGDTLATAQRIHAICRERQLKAAVNFQLRFSPYMLAVRDFISRGELGDIVDAEVHLNLETPWDLFPFLLDESRVEIMVHTVHHLDLLRLFLGDPRSVYARTVKHPRFPKLASVRSSIILDYGDMIRCCLSVNHCHRYGPRHSTATVRIEGTEGCAVATLGLLLDYPKGREDKLEIIGRSMRDWTDVPLQGKWFPDGFVGTMSNLQRFAAGEDSTLVSSVDDALETMRLVEACYVSSERGGIPMNSLGDQ
jgi:predicted dehydrogenase